MAVFFFFFFWKPRLRKNATPVTNANLMVFFAGSQQQNLTRQSKSHMHQLPVNTDSYLQNSRLLHLAANNTRKDAFSVTDCNILFQSHSLISTHFPQKWKLLLVPNLRTNEQIPRRTEVLIGQIQLVNLTWHENQQGSGNSPNCRKTTVKHNQRFSDQPHSPGIRPGYPKCTLPVSPVPVEFVDTYHHGAPPPPLPQNKICWLSTDFFQQFALVFLNSRKVFRGHGPELKLIGYFILT